MRYNNKTQFFSLEIKIYLYCRMSIDELVDMLSPHFDEQYPIKPS